MQAKDRQGRTSQGRNKKGQAAIIVSNDRLQLRCSYSGKRHYISTGLEDTKENWRVAEARKKEIEADIAWGKFDETYARYKPHAALSTLAEVPKQSLELHQLWERYTEHRKSQIAETTLKKDYAQNGRYIHALPTKDISQANAIRNHIVETKPSYTAKKLIVAITACCRFALKSGLIESNEFIGMAEEIKIKKSQDSIDPFIELEKQAITEIFENTAYSDFVKFLFYTGCRTGEGLALQWKHISSDCRTITFCESWNDQYQVRKDTKTHITRKFPCNSSLQQFLQSIKPENVDSEEEVFDIGSLRHFQGNWKQKVGSLVEKGLVERYRPQYNTRHTFITQCLEHQVSVPQIAKWVGNPPEIIMKHYAGTISQVQVPEF